MDELGQFLQKNHGACFIYEPGPAGNGIWETAHINEYGK